jgi:Ca2+-binding RTX toxin-like protein
VVVDLGGAGDPPVGDGVEDVVTVATTPAADTLEIPVGTGERLVAGLPWEVRVLHAEPELDRVAVPGVGNDRVEVNGTPGDDVVSILPSGGAARVLPDVLGAPVDLSGALALAVYGFAGNDTIAGANGLAATLVPIEIYGGKGDDTLTGSNGSELIRGEAGNDVVTPAQGNDAVFLGSGVDQVLWSPGDGSDVVEGESGNDTLVFAASNGGEVLELSKLGRRLQLFRNIGNVVMDLGGVEQVDLRALGGADNLVVNDLRGSAVKRVDVDLAGASGVDDAQVDAVVVQGTPRVDKIGIATDADGVVVTRPRLVLRLLYPEALLDTLTVNGLAGADRIEAAPDVASRIGLTINPD